MPRDDRLQTAMSSSLKMTPLLMGMVFLFLFAGRVHAFGAGNIASISKVEGQNCKRIHIIGLIPIEVNLQTNRGSCQGVMATSRTHS